MNDQSQNSETFADQLLGASIPARDTRLRLVRLDETLAEILAAHDYPPAIRNLLAEALVIGALIGGLIDEDEGQMTMQAQTRAGVVNLLVCDFRAGAIRGYVDFDKEKLAELGANPSLKALFGEGDLAITFDVPERGGRYQGIVPLEGESLAEACESYFMQSEPVPTMVRVAVSTSGNRTLAAGLLALTAIILAIPLGVTYAQTGLVPRLPTAILATGLTLLAFLSLFTGLILDTVVRGRREVRRLAYLAFPAPGSTADR